MTYIRTGTITATNGSKVITGSGTRFITDQILVGDAIYIGAEGVPYDVTSVNSETSLGIAVSYTGTTGSSKKYVVMPVQGHNHDLAMRARDLILSYKEGVARSVLDAELALKADKTDSRLTDAREWTATTISQAEAEAGTASTRRAFTAQRLRQGITAWYTGISGAAGRTILGRSTAEQVRGDLGLGTAATKNVGTSAGNVMEVGAFNWGAVGATSGGATFRNGIAFESPSITGNATNVLTVGGADRAMRLAARGNIIAVQTLEGENNPIYLLYHTGNTTKNPDGTLKASSPVINLYTDNYELHNEAQFGATPTVTRKSKGVYEISGTLGFRSEGWYLDTPSDRNGNKYFNIEWSQNITPESADGVVDEYRDDIVVTIETFERVWNKDTGLFENGTPIDINELQDRFVQLRFNEIKIEHEELIDEAITRNQE